MEINANEYLQLLMEENKRHNLVSRQTTKTDLEYHVRDSLQILQWYHLSGQRVIDIGTGAGFPGLVLALAEPDCLMTLVEADMKKSRFLQHVVENLQLSNVKVIRDRVESLGRDKNYREEYDLCTSRAVASMRIMLEYGIPLIKVGGRLLLWKGSHFRSEIDEAEQALHMLGGCLEEFRQYNLIHEGDRAIVVVRKLYPTPPQYPRKVGTPSKRPL